MDPPANIAIPRPWKWVCLAVWRSEVCEQQVQQFGGLHVWESVKTGTDPQVLHNIFNNDKERFPTVTTGYQDINVPAADDECVQAVWSLFRSQAL